MVIRMSLSSQYSVEMSVQIQVKFSSYFSYILGEVNRQMSVQYLSILSSNHALVAAQKPSFLPYIVGGLINGGLIDTTPPTYFFLTFLTPPC